MDPNATSAWRAPIHLVRSGDGFLHTMSELPASTIRSYIAAFVCLVVAIKWLSSTAKSFRRSQLPIINNDSWDVSKSKAEFLKNAKTIIQHGFEKFQNGFNVVIDDGRTQIMLPPKYIDSVNQEAKLSFSKFTEDAFLSHLNTFRQFRPPVEGLFEEAMIKGLTRSLPKFTTTLSEEMGDCLDETWGNSSEWHDVPLRTDVLKWVARLSARIFVGHELSANEEWLRISVDYTVSAFQAVEKVKAWPGFLWRFAEWYEPLCRTVRKDYAEAKAILNPIVDARKQEIAQAQREGRKPDLPDDSFEWFRSAAKGREYNDTDVQIGLALAAIHTTSDLLGQAILNLCKYPEAIDPMRGEIVHVLSQYGWQKVALTEVRLLDSFLKETQRLKPIGMASMHRKATDDVELPGGLTISKGEKMAISSYRMWSEDVYEDAKRFDAWRFVKRRQIPELQHSSHLVSTSRDHLGFSHGKHACPGRFFAANEVKIAMMHLLLKYDVEAKDPTKLDWIESGVRMSTNPFAKIRVKRRQEELNLQKIDIASR